MLQTGEAQFAFPIPYEQAPLLAKNSKLELVASPSIMQRYISMNVTRSRSIIRRYGKPSTMRLTVRRW